MNQAFVLNGFPSTKPNEPFSSLDQLKRDLDRCFNTAQHGTFAVTGVRTQYEHPGLLVNGIGHVSLPILDAEALKSVAEHQGDHIWRISANRIRFLNPKWDEFVQTSIVQPATLELGIPAPVRANTKAVLSGLVLRQDRSEVDADLPRPSNSFANVAICLPSPFQSGKVFFKHHERTAAWTTDMMESAFGLSFAAWYHGISQQARSSSSGYRLWLHYHLVNGGSARAPSVEDLDVSDRTLRRCLHKWTDLLHDPDKDPATTLSLRTLNSVDRRTVSQVRRIGKESGFTVYLAKLRLIERGNTGIGEDDDDYDYHANLGKDFHSLINVDEEDWSLVKVYDLDGEEVIEDVAVTRTSLIQNDFFGSQRGEEDDWDPETGECEHVKDGWAMVIVPAARAADFSIKPGNQTHGSIGTIVAGLVNAPAEKEIDALRDKVREAAAAVAVSAEFYGLQSPEDRKPKYDDDDLYMAAKGAFHLQDPDLFSRVLRHLRQAPTLEFYYTWASIGEDDLPRFEASFIDRLSRHKTVSSQVTSLQILTGNFLARYGGWSKLLGPVYSLVRAITKWVQKWTKQTEFLFSYLAESDFTAPKLLREAFADLVAKGMEGMTVATL
ncbi:Hypothetical protein D9617_5g071220 [Elsinoe fawcettii]|nr:Hypothetical protein D9617_5g071220 [Elsinoe fawcettii]